MSQRCWHRGTAFKVLLYRYTMITDICVGTPVARRNRPEIENAIGCFINTLPLRTDLSEDPSLLDLLARVKQTCIEAFARQDVPFQRLVEELSPVRDLSHTPIFQIMLILHVQDTLKISRLGDVELSMLEYRSTTSKVDLTLELKETDDGLEGWFEYSTDLFDESTVGRMAAQFERLLGSIVSDPARRISELDILPSDERRRLLVDWNATESDHPRESTVQELFAAQSARTPKRRLGDVEEREEHDFRYDTSNESVGKASRRYARSSTCCRARGARGYAATPFLGVKLPPGER